MVTGREAGRRGGKEGRMGGVKERGMEGGEGGIEVRWMGNGRGRGRRRGGRRRRGEVVYMSFTASVGPRASIVLSSRLRRLESRIKG